ncbi:MAG TPA: DUF4097 family beta strand repeat-containing protein [Thermoanaerobaculia bacterium]|nr:DUF4097 family beta strand repeat-containing protein [Thermoanaerobaculia bacterium]
MRPFKALILSILSLVLLSADARAETLTEKFAKTYPLAADGSLSLTNVNGDVTFEAWDRAEVQVNAEKKVKAGTAEDARKILSQIRIDVQAEPSAVRIETKTPKKVEGGGFWNALFGGNDVSMGVTYRVKVPRDAIVEADNVNGGIRLSGTRGTGRLETVNGAVDVEGTSGALVLESTNGNIKIARSEGAVKASTTNGNIEADLDRLAADRDLGFSTTNGEVSIRLPRDARLSVDAATTNGSIDSDVAMSKTSSRRNHLTGDINGGGATLRIRTTNGSVEISEI